MFKGEAILKKMDDMRRVGEIEDHPTVFRGLFGTGEGGWG